MSYSVPKSACQHQGGDAGIALQGLKFLQLTGRRGRDGWEITKCYLDDESDAICYGKGGGEVACVYTAMATAERRDALFMSIPDNPKLYHIVHVNRLRSILADGPL